MSQNISICKDVNFESVFSMYSDLQNLEIIKIKNDKEVKKYLKKLDNFNLQKIGFEFRDLKNKYFDEDFYNVRG